MPDHARNPRPPLLACARGGRTAVSGLVLMGTLLGVCVGGGGCQKTALRADDIRSQYDRYDQARNQRAQPFLQDEFGRRTPNLRQRLLVGDE